MIVVIDTNVWISAMLSANKSGIPFQAIRKAALHHQIATCDPIEQEILRIMTVKFGWTKEASLDALASLSPFPKWVELQGNLRLCRDPNDDMILECAVLAEAGIVVSGDKDLLTLGICEGIRILTPAEFLIEFA